MGSHPDEPAIAAVASNRELLAQKLRQKAAGARTEHPLSHGQSALVFVHGMNPRSPAYNLAFVARVISDVNVDALEKALQRLVDRHDSLRTTYAERDGKYFQVVHGAIDFHLEQVDATDWDESELSKRVFDAYAEPYDLETGPVVRARLFRLSDDHYVLLFGIHHIATDGWSQGILLGELRELYAAHAGGRSAALPPVGVKYTETVERRAQVLAGERGIELWAFWENELRGKLATLDLPTDFPRPVVPSEGGDATGFRVEGDSYTGLKSVVRAEGVTPYILLLAVFQVLLMRYAGKKDVLVGTPMAARSEPEFENVVGYFVNPVVIRGDLAEGLTFREYLQRLRATVFGALAHQDFPFSLLVERLSPSRDANRSPLFEVMFNLQSRETLGAFADLLESEGMHESFDFGGMRIEPFPLLQQAGAFDLMLDSVDTGSGIDCSLLFRSDLFRKDTVDRMAVHFQTLLAGVLAHPDTRVSDLPILPEKERRRILVEWNETTADYPKDSCIHELFESQAALSPDAVAVVFGRKRLTYRQLSLHSNQLANHLRKIGVGPDVLVGILLDRSPEMVLGLLGVLKAGGAYVPLDPSYPPGRLDFMVHDARMPVLLTKRRLRERCPGFGGRTVLLDHDWSDIAQESSASPTVDVSSENAAYVIYTSGSTGVPKGVIGTHSAAINRFDWMWKAFPFEKGEVCCQKTSASFIDSVWELFGPLLKGFEVVILPDSVVKDPNLLVETLTAARITRIVMVPSLLRVLLEGYPDLQSLLPDLRLWVCSGERLPKDLAQLFRERMPRSRLLNLYGSSEVSADSTCYQVGDGAQLASVPIGRPIQNTQVYVLDEDAHPVPVGVTGELYIGGAGLAKGYLNRPELTAARFVNNPFESGGLLYRTGDLGRYLVDGNIEYLGRADRQVKIRGYRIELEELEAALKRHNSVAQAVVNAREDVPGDVRLVAYIVRKAKAELSFHDLARYLHEQLPPYMLPSSFVFLEEIPLLPNGKIDHQRLPKPGTPDVGSPTQYRMPRDQIEMQLVDIWQKVLGIERVGITDDFFALGGHSLLAARLFARISAVFGKKIPLSAIFECPTIGKMADLLRQEDWRPDWSSLVAVQPRGTKPPLFLVHGAEGNVLLYRNLASYLGPDQPVYGLQSKGLDGTQKYHCSLEEMAASYLKEIRRIQPEGPYYLGGYCMGGGIALEIAQQLRAQGHTVALLAMLETLNLQSNPKALSFYWELYHGIQRILFQIGNLMLLGHRGGAAYFFEKVRVEKTRFRILINVRLSKFMKNRKRRDGSEYPHFLLSKHNDGAFVEYRPREYAGRITLFRPQKGFAGFNTATYGWSKVAEMGVDVQTLPVYPRGMLVEPFVKTLAERLDESLRKARGEAG
jgi:amino acid adenylation domain-containing protein